MEIFRSYFYDSKKNKPRSKAKMIFYFAFFAFLIIGVLGGMFTFLSLLLCGTFVSLGLGWFYYFLMGSLSILLGTFGSVFNTFQSLYLAKDNDLLLSMPIPVSTIMTARLLGVYLLGTMYSATALIPAIIVYCINTKWAIASIIGGISMLLFVTLFVFVLSCLLGFIVAKISTKIKNKSFVTVLVSLLFFGAYYFFYFKAQEYVSAILENALIYGDIVKNSAYPLYLFGRVGEGDAFSVMIFIAAVLLLCAAVFILISRSFVKIATSSGAAKSNTYKEKRAKQKGKVATLLSKEFSRLYSSSLYMLNSCLGILFIPALGIVFLLKGDLLLSAFSFFGEGSGIPLVLMAAILCMAMSMVDVGAPSVSLEGKNMWILQSLPVDMGDVITAKLFVQLFLTLIPTVFSLICIVIAAKFPIFDTVLFVISVLMFCLMMSLFDIFASIKFANLNYTNELVPIKQGLSVFLAIFGVWGMAIAFGGIYFAVAKYISVGWYFAASSAVFAAVSLILYKWIYGRGKEKLKTL